MKIAVVEILIFLTLFFIIIFIILLSKRVKKNARQAYNLYNFGKFDLALEHFQVLYNKTRNAEYLYRIAMCYFKLGNYATAITAFNNVYSNISELANITEDMIMKQLFYCHIKLNNASEAEKIIVDFELNTANSDLYLEYADFKFNNSDFINSANIYKKIIQINNNNIKAMTGLAKSYLRIKDYKNAISTFTKILKIKPNYSEVYYELGNAYFKNNDNMNAIDAYTRGLEISTGNLKFNIISALVRAFFGSNEYEAAIEYLLIGLSEFKKHDEKNTELQYLLATAYHKTNKKDDALRLLKEIYKKNPNYENTAELISKLTPKKNTAQILNFLKEIDKSYFNTFINAVAQRYDMTIKNSNFIQQSEILITGYNYKKNETLAISIKLWDKPAGDIVLFDFKEYIASNKADRGILFIAAGLGGQTYNLLQTDELKNIAVIEKNQFAELLNEILRMI